MPLERLTPEKRRELTRAHLLAAAAEVFAERGFHGATLDQIADAAGFSKGAVYSNFESKDELFLALIQEQGEAMVQAYAEVEERLAGQDISPAQRIAAMADVYMRDGGDLTQSWALMTEFDLYALRNPEVRRRLVEGGRAMHQLVVDLVHRHGDDVGIDPALPAEQVATLYTAIFMGLWRQRALDPDSVPDDLAAEAVVLVGQAVDMLGTPKKQRRRTAGSR